MSMISPSKSPFTRKPNATLKALTPRKSSKLSTIQGVSLTSVKNNNNEPQLDFADQIVHVKQQLFSLTSLKIGPNTKMLDVSNNELVDFKGLPSLQRLTRLVVSNNNIATLFNLPPLPMLRTIEIDNTPFVSQEYYRISLILMCPSLHKINGELVKPSERKVAKEYLPECVNLLRTGWVMKYPPPSQEQIIVMKRKLAKKIAMKAPKKNEGAVPKAIFRTVKNQSVMYNDCLKAQREEISKLEEELAKLEAKYQEEYY
ncbi:hypothetical protein TRFO_27428 [Tritrichomonas foetus]|uniref:Leucine Rich Repeat family protein n=1 Tax=Tritrichomonas foetus TaxID=1144522 RepID=A0A1J4K5H5_9EUKA|nr:hypothetical protein TRFO_27428 [Tritrichomonas foetus]|eukprot:OHT04980.1 hypothetical protein TRFO_27428 [Tritrichomonas foetus]